MFKKTGDEHIGILIGRLRESTGMSKPRFCEYIRTMTGVYVSIGTLIRWEKGLGPEDILTCIMLAHDVTAKKLGMPVSGILEIINTGEQQ